MYFDTAPCVGTNHNNGDTCLHDPLYDDALISTPANSDGVTFDTITVTVIDDDIADLVVLCGDNAGGAPTVDAGAAAVFEDSCALHADETACTDSSGCAWAGGYCIFSYDDDEAFIGSYDDSHPHNRWDEGVERRGADAEDGMSYSLFGGGISTYYDGISGGGTSAVATGRPEKPRPDGEICKNCGYVSIVEVVENNGAGEKNEDEGPMTRNRCITRVMEPGTLNTLTETLGNTDGEASSDLGGDQEGCYPDAATNPSYYDPYSDRYCTAGNGAQYGPHCDGTDFRDPAANGDFVAAHLHVRGFKGVGPALTEPDTEDSYVCTIHSRECKMIADELVDGENNDCEYGEFKVRLNSSPGTKKVVRQYAGVADQALEEELVTIVITPDETPQTRFVPSSVTFTHTGGVVDGKLTHRWDAPVVIEVVPVDDAVDERAGVIVDFTAFTVTPVPSISSSLSISLLPRRRFDSC
eukprot:SAG11_NODE_233_length_11903_cov_4.983650_6_plen_468_part_00